MKILVSVALAATMASTFAHAENSFSLARVQSARSLIHFDVVNSDSGGIIEVYGYNTGMPGTLLGTKTIGPGANADVWIQLNPQPFGPALARLVVGGTVVAEQEIAFRHTDR